ncbi:hypothetical protein [Microbispora rosea]|uniref:hypothetical protein n=1 Tax=Microbispora rosea TaxID=58117 RepID=UPI0034358BB4
MGRRDAHPGWSNALGDDLQAFDAYLASIERTVDFIRAFEGGLSGSPVLLVRDRIGDNLPRQRILKLCRTDDEPDRIAVAYQAAPQGFRAAHMAAPEHTRKLDGCSLIFMDVAGNDLENCRPLADLLHRPNLASVCRKIVFSLLKDWNSNSAEIERPYTVAEFLQILLGSSRLAAGGPLADFAARARIDMNAETVLRQGWARELRNPFILADPGTAAGKSLVPGGALVGKGHGDLSVFNLLIPTYPRTEPKKYQIIDYGGYSSRRPVTWDSMYLLVSLATRWLSGMNPASDPAKGLLLSLADHRTDRERFGLREHHAVIKALFEAGHAWAQDKTYGDRWLPQCALSLCAAGLIFIGRRIPGLEGSIDDWLFELAATAAQDFVEQTGIPVGVTDLSSYRERRNSKRGVEDTDAVALLRHLEEAEFDCTDWLGLTRGVTGLRAFLREQRHLVIESPHAVRIRTLITALEEALEAADDPRLEPVAFERAVDRLKRIAGTLLTLLLG